MTVPDEVAETYQKIARAVRAARFNCSNEAELQAAIATVFEAAGIGFEREVRLTAKDRIDFLCAGGLGVEVKVGGDAAHVLRQLHRYAQRPEVLALMLITTRATHRTIATDLNGKHVWLFHIETAFS